MSEAGAFEQFLLWERASRDTLEVKRAYIDMAGDLVAGVVLSQIVYWHLPSREGKARLRVKREGHLWLAKGRGEWWDECRISPKQADRALEVLEQKGLIEVRLFRFGAAPTKHLRIRQEEFLRAWKDAVARETATGEPGPGGGGGGVFDFDQRSKSISTKGQNPFTPKVEMDFPQRVKTLTETTTETTTSAARPAEGVVAASGAAAAALEEELVGHGVSRAVARRLAREKPAVCRRCIEYLPFATFRKSKGAWLASAIRDEFGPPPGFVEEQVRKGRAEATKAAVPRGAARQADEEPLRRAKMARLAQTLRQMEKGQEGALSAFVEHLASERRKAERIASRLTPARRDEYLASFNSEEHRVEVFARWLERQQGEKHRYRPGPGRLVEAASGTAPYEHAPPR